MGEKIKRVENVLQNKWRNKKYNKPYKNGKHTQSLDYVYYCTIFKMFGYRRPWIVKTPILNQPIYIKIILTS